MNRLTAGRPNATRLIAVCLIIAGLAALTLSACSNNDALKTDTLFPGRLLSQNEWSDSQSAWCQVNVPGLGQGLSNTGTGASYGVSRGELLVGFEDRHSHGADPAACDTTDDFLYRGNVAFDLRKFDSIFAAHLEYDFIDSFIGSNGAATAYPPTCAATVLGIASGQDFWDYDDWQDLTAACRRPPSGGSSFSVDVTVAVRNWLLKQHVDYGFILAGPKLDFPRDLPDDNNVSVTWYGNFRLIVQYFPRQNPRAPH
jgi:hypothetical protein